ncbi:MAG: hypothetical protein INR71_07945, partial [Terriglobus roseus]|nr:hypothetical protein [Terriglobus roseus]
ERKPAEPKNIREIRLPSENEVDLNGDVHLSAFNTAYALWADEYFRQQAFAASPLPPPTTLPNAEIWNDEKNKFPPIPGYTTPERARSGSTGGGVPLQPMTVTRHSSGSSSSGGLHIKFIDTNPSRADSVLTGMTDSISPTSTRFGGTFSSPVTFDSPLLRHSRRQLSALAQPFSPPTAVHPALSSRAALPTPPGQLPGTFDVLANGKAGFSILIITDVPFNVSVNEVLTHLKLGEREGLVHYGPDNPAIHIIQDRADSKTHEVYVEMLNYEAAARVLRDMPKRGIKIGSTGSSRKIKVAMCKPDKMMNAVFPRPAKAHAWQFRWAGFEPDLSSIPDGFIGYVSSEDLHNAREWAEHPRKAKHADDAPQRVYEFMITTLVLLPKDLRAHGHLKTWASAQEFLDRLFVTCVSMIKTLNRYVDDPRFAERHVRKEHAHLLHFRLLKRFNQTCFDFPLFSESQREQFLAGF